MYFSGSVCGDRCIGVRDGSLRYTTPTLFLSGSSCQTSHSEFFELLSSTDDVKAFITNAHISMTMGSVCGKATNILRNRKGLIELTNVLLKGPCRPRTIEKSANQKKYDEINRLELYIFFSGIFLIHSFRLLTNLTTQMLTNLSIMNKIFRLLFCIRLHIVYYDYLFFYWDLLKVEYFALCLADRSFRNSGCSQFPFKRVSKRTLPFNAWLPYDHSTIFSFGIACLHQI